MTKLIQNANCYEMQHQLTYYECTDSGHPSMSMLLSMMTMVSDAHSIFVGLDRTAVDKSGGAWVIVGYEGQLAPHQPHFGDQVIIGTRALAYNQFFALREFWLSDLDHQQQYVHVKALFVMMDLKARRLMRIPAELITPFASPLKKRLPRLAKPEQQPTEYAARDYQVRYFDIDINHHVNNARYLDWMLDPLGPDFLRGHRPVAFRINYEAEVQEGATVESRYYLKRQEKGVTTVHEIWAGGRCCTTAELEWQPV